MRGHSVGPAQNRNVCAFTYGPGNLRLSESVNGILTTYLLDGDQVVTDTINGSANQTLYGPGTDHPLARNGEFFLPNHLNSTTGLTNGSGSLTQSYLYGPFGESLNAPSDSNPFQFTGRENDGDGLLYYRARYYCPSWGRFLSSDPAGFAAGINPFVYAGNNPVNHTDPSGQADDGTDSGQSGSDDAAPSDTPPGAANPAPSDGPDTSPDTATAQPADDGNPSEDAQTQEEQDAMNAAAAPTSGGDSGNPDVTGGPYAGGTPVGNVQTEPVGDPGIGRMNPWLIKYTQDSVSWNFRDGGYNIGDTVFRLLTEPEFDTPPVRLFERGGEWWTLDNRRVLTYRSAGRDVPYISATRQEVADESWKFDTRSGGVRVFIRMPRGWR